MKLVLNLVAGILAGLLLGLYAPEWVARVLFTAKTVIGQLITFTIPLMKKVGYPPYYAGAVEACASTGGQLMPPIIVKIKAMTSSIYSAPFCICLHPTDGENRTQAIKNPRRTKTKCFAHRG